VDLDQLVGLDLLDHVLNELEGVVGGKNEKGWEYEPKKIPAGCTTYRIQRGDTMKSIAEAHNTTTAQLLKLNKNIVNANRIVAGFWLIVPIG
jgi:spore germination protein YaaH